MDNEILAVVISVTGGVIVALINGIVSVLIKSRTADSAAPPVNPYKWIVVFLAVFGIFMGGFYLNDRLADDAERGADAGLSTLGNTTEVFTARDFEHWDTVLAVDDQGQSLDMPGRILGTQTGDADGRAYYEYELAIDDDELRHYQIPYMRPLQGELITAQVYIDDPDDRLAANTVRLAAVGLQADAMSLPRAETRVTVTENAWHMVVLDMRSRTGADGTTAPFSLRLQFDLQGSTAISADTAITVRVANVALLDQPGANAYVYARDGWSVFTPFAPISSAEDEFSWLAPGSETYAQDATPRIVERTVGGVTGTFVEYPVTLGSIQRIDWIEATRRARLNRALRESEREFDVAIATVYIDSDEDTVVECVPLFILEGNLWQQGFWQDVPTNQWVTVVWNRTVDSSPYGRENYESDFLAMRLDPEEPQVGFIRLVQILTDRVPIERMGLSFVLHPDRPQDEEDSLEATIYLGTMTLLDY